MDPNAALKMLVEAAEAVEAEVDAERQPSAELVAKLAGAALALDHWMRNGGFIPSAWTELRSAR